MQLRGDSLGDAAGLHGLGFRNWPSRALILSFSGRA
jgi:hypothetical protein